MASAIKGKKKVKFQAKANPGDRVFVAGSFNGWDPEDLELLDRTLDGNFERTVFLPMGRYEYKLVINGVWSIDSGCEKWITNSYGSLNSVIEIR